MSKFVRVDQAPKDTRNNDIVVTMPTFLEEVDTCMRAAGRTKVMTENFLRVLIDEVGKKYDPTLNAYHHRVNNFFGRPYKTREDIATILHEFFEKSYPQIYDKYLESQITNRPFGTDLIYFVGPHQKTTAFFKCGVEEVKQKDLKVYLGLEKKKPTPGRPTPTKAELELRTTPTPEQTARAAAAKKAKEAHDKAQKGKENTTKTTG